MTRPKPRPLQTLHPKNGGFYVRVNCLVCGGGVEVEGGSKGRDEIPACQTVSQAVYCPACRLQGVVEVRFGVVTQYRNGARIG